MNTGQFKTVLRDQLFVDAQSLTKTSGQPFAIAELEAAIGKFFDGIPDNEGGEVAGQRRPAARTARAATTMARFSPEHHSPQSEGPRMNDMTPSTTLKDWETDQEVRWCPGCGDYAILKAVQRTLPQLGADPGQHRVRQRHRLFEPVSRITSKATASTRSTAARRPSRPGSSSPTRSSTCGW